MSIATCVMPKIRKLKYRGAMAFAASAAPMWTGVIGTTIYENMSATGILQPATASPPSRVSASASVIVPTDECT